MAAGFGAFAKVTKVGHFTVRGARKIIAELYFLGNATRSTTVASVLEYHSRSPLVTVSASTGADGPLIPGLLDTVNRARSAVAFPVLRVDLRAHPASTLHLPHDGTEALAYTEVAAGLVARTPFAKVRNLAVHSANEIVAAPGLEGNVAGFAAKFSSLINGSISLLLALATSVGALRPRLPYRQFAVSRAWFGVTGFVPIKMDAFLAAVHWCGHNSSVLVLEASATGGRAWGPLLAELAEHTVDFARGFIAWLLISHRWAECMLGTCVLSDSAGPSSGATTAFLCARFEGRPFRYVTVDRAVTFLALDSLAQRRTWKSAKYTFFYDSARTSLDTVVATSGCALGKCTVVRHFAVHGTGDGHVLARLHFFNVRARFATRSGRGSDVTPSLALTSPAAQGAGGPSVPHRYFAINWASLQVARSRFFELWAWYATVLGFCCDGPDTLLHAYAATARARRPLRPVFGDSVNGVARFAVRGTMEIIAFTLFYHGWALYTAVYRCSPNGASTSLAASIAALSAFGPEAILVQQAIDRAFLSVTSVGFCVQSTALAAPHGGYDDMPGPLVVASAASLCALGEIGPGGHTAVNWAWFLIAVSKFVGDRASSTMERLARDFSVTLLGACATGFRALSPITPGRHIAIIGAEPQVAFF